MGLGLATCNLVSLLALLMGRRFLGRGARDFFLLILPILLPFDFVRLVRVRVSGKVRG